MNGIRDRQTTLYQTALLCRLRVSLLDSGQSKPAFTAAHAPVLANMILELELSEAEQARSD